jgi:deoxyribonuclease-4
VNSSSRKSKKPLHAPLLGAHMSIEGGVSRAIGRGVELGCTTIQIFTKNANQWNAPPLEKEEVRLFHQAREKAEISPVVGHDAYLINLASTVAPLRLRSAAALSDEMERCQRLGLPYLVMHPGSHRGAGEEEGLRLIAQSLNEILSQMKTGCPTVLLEITAGQGTALGCRFEHLAWLIEHLDGPTGVCFDTCHAFAAGYDLRTREAYEETFSRFDGVVGLNHLKVIHINDSLRGLGSRIDRHQHIGQGQLGLEPFRFIMNDPRFQNIPKLLETPKEKDGEDMDRINLEILRGIV